MKVNCLESNMRENVVDGGHRKVSSDILFTLTNTFINSFPSGKGGGVNKCGGIDIMCEKHLQYLQKV